MPTIVNPPPTDGNQRRRMVRPAGERGGRRAEFFVESVRPRGDQTQSVHTEAPDDKKRFSLHDPIPICVY